MILGGRIWAEAEVVQEDHEAEEVVQEVPEAVGAAHPVDFPVVQGAVCGILGPDIWDRLSGQRLGQQ